MVLPDARKHTDYIISDPTHWLLSLLPSLSSEPQGKIPKVRCPLRCPLSGLGAHLGSLGISWAYDQEKNTCISRSAQLQQWSIAWELFSDAWQGEVKLDETKSVVVLISHHQMCQLPSFTLHLGQTYGFHLLQHHKNCSSF